MNISGSKTKRNNKLTNLTININSQHIQRDEVGDTWNYTEQNNLSISYRIVSYRAKILAGKNVSEMTYFVSTGT